MLRLAVAAGIAAAFGLLYLLGWIAVTHLRFHLYHRRRGLSYPPLGFAGWALFYARTVASVLQLFAWSVRARFSSGLRTPADGAAGPPVLCVHGFHMNATSMWGLRRTLERHGHATRAVYLGLPYRRVEVYARSLAAALERLREETGGGRVDVVAHSMGGLVLRLVLSRRPDLAAAVRRVVTLGTPHHGTGLLPSRGRGPVSRMMSRGSAFLATLPPFAESAPVAAVTTIGSAHDLLVYPVDTVHLAAAQQVTLEGVGHLGMLTERRVRQRVAALLDAPDAEAGSGVTRRAGPVAR